MTSDDGNPRTNETQDGGDTRPLDPELQAALERYEQAVEAGEGVDVDDLCRDLPGREQELHSVIAAMRRLSEREEKQSSAPPAMNLAAATPLQPATPGRPTTGIADPLVGHSITAASRLRQLRYHARGGLGCVFKAFDEEIGRDVAVKVVGIERQHDEESQERFLREAEVTGRLRHPGIVPVYTRGETVDGRPFFVMPFMEEGSLETAINVFHQGHPAFRASDPQFRDLLGRFIAACKTVAYAHSRGVVHRDLKPHNIMLGRYGETLVIDWGLAEKSRRDVHHRLSGEQSIEVRGSSTASSSSGGFTPQYASPEQMDGTMEVGPASDVYSLGAILYKLTTGTTPLSATTLGDMRRACLNGDFQPPKERHRSVPWALNAICLKAMQTDARDRYDSPEDLAVDVEAFLADSPVTAAPERLSSRVARTVRRRWPAVMGVMGALLLVAVVALFAAVHQRSLKGDARASSKSRLQLAARLAAQAGGGEIDRRWRLLEFEALSNTLRGTVDALNLDWEDVESKNTLQSHMTERFVQMREIDGVKFVSLLVLGADGRILSRVPSSDSIGGHYAYRDYFHGKGGDLSEHASPPPFDRVVLSSVFVSTVTEKPHVAMSVPIQGPEDGETEGTVIGRLAMTLFVGDLGMFDHLGSEEVPMLLETRKYKWADQNSYGLVVHHPDLQTIDITSEQTGELDLPKAGETELNAILKRVERQRDTSEEAIPVVVEDFVDPVQNRSVQAAFAPVTIGARPKADRESGWFVVLYPRSSED